MAQKVLTSAFMATDKPQRHLQDLWQKAAAATAPRMHLLRYAGFAVLAIFINLLFQNVILAAFSAMWFGIYLAIALGNGAGLIFKYFADKYWVFDDVDASLVNNSRKFLLYAAFGVGTTLLFWSVELAFHYIFQTVLMTNVGALIGLTLGYVIKYNLDKHITFAAAERFDITPFDNSEETP